MQHLGNTRSVRRSNYLLHTPDAFVRAPLPGMTNATAVVHIGPAGGARFTQYTVEFESGAQLAPAADQRFVYVLSGGVSIGGKNLGQDDYAYLPAGDASKILATSPSRAAVVEKPYAVWNDLAAPEFLAGCERQIEPRPLMGDPWLEVRTLIPDDPAFDFAVNTMTFQPGAALPMVEMHVMEHGLLMLAGGGIYRLGDEWHPVTAGDFIWMGPYCPQWFAAVGKTPAKYLIYKDWNRHPLAEGA